MANPNSTLQAIRARLAQAEQKKGQNFDNAFYPFWNAKTDTTSELRFLPDGNQDNTYFWVEKLQIKLPFNGIKGGDTKPVTVSVPCVEMFGRELYPQGCPILSEVRAWYKEAKASGDEALTKKANTYWKKPQFIMQGFVRKSAVQEENVPENPIRRYSLNKQLFNLVKAGLMDAEMINLPCDYENGSDFYITKTSKGGTTNYADYGTSKYSRRESTLTQTELDAIEKFGLSNLSEFLGKKPTEEELVIIREMFEASVDGEAYDQARWGNFFRPSGVKSDKEAAETPETEAKTETTSKKETKETASTSHAENESVAAPAGDNKSASAILEMIKARGKKTAEAKSETKA